MPTITYNPQLQFYPEQTFTINGNSTYTINTALSSNWTINQYPPGLAIPAPPREGKVRSSNCTAYYHNGLYHREDGPALEYDEGRKEWWINGQRHRVDGPAIEYSNGNTEWFCLNKRHRTDGPAVVMSDRKEWYVNGKRHREDGPATEYLDGYKEWYYQGRVVEVASQDAFNRYVVADKYL
jgi:hypothetical protein